MTPEELTAARARDNQDLEEIASRYRALIEVVSQLPSAVQFSHANALREKIDELIKDAISVGGPATETAASLTNLRSSLLASMKQTAADQAEPTEALANAEAFYQQGILTFNNPLVQQLSRRQGPIAPEDVVSTVLSADLETIRAVVRAMPPAAQQILLEDAFAISAEASMRGYPASELEAKLEALGHART